MKKIWWFSLLCLLLSAIVLSSCGDTSPTPAVSAVNTAANTGTPPTTLGTGAAPSIARGTVSASPIADSELTPHRSPVATSHGGPVIDYVSLIDNLRAAGATVTPTGAVTQEFLDKNGQVINVNGGNAQVFEYPNTASADAAATRIAPDGRSARNATGGATSVDWLGAPHLYKINRLIVVYIGNDAGVLTVLKAVVGSQFAGDA